MRAFTAAPWAMSRAGGLGAKAAHDEILARRVDIERRQQRRLIRLPGLEYAARKPSLKHQQSLCPKQDVLGKFRLGQSEPARQVVRCDRLVQGICFDVLIEELRRQSTHSQATDPTCIAA